MEFVDGQTLTQWMIDNPKPELETVRGIVEQIVKGLGAFTGWRCCIRTSGRKTS